MSALKGKTKNSPEDAMPGDTKHGHSSGPAGGGVLEEEEFEILLPENPEEGLSQDATQDWLGGLREDAGTPQRLRLILVGKPGSGKSATGNSILGQKVFESKVSARPVTTAFQRGCRVWAGKELEVIDTPDILCPRAALRGTAQGIREAIAFLLRPHAVLLVTQLGRFTEEDQQAARRLQEVFGEGILARTVLVFTRKEDLDGGSLEEYLRGTNNRELAKLDVLCERRHCGFNNKVQGAEQEAQLKELMAQIECVLWEHEGRSYSNQAHRYSPHNLLLQQEGEGQVLQGQGSAKGPSEESWLQGLCQIQRESEHAHRQLLERAPI